MHIDRRNCKLPGHRDEESKAFAFNTREQAYTFREDRKVSKSKAFSYAYGSSEGKFEERVVEATRSRNIYKEVADSFNQASCVSCRNKDQEVKIYYYWSTTSNMFCVWSDRSEFLGNYATDTGVKTDYPNAEWCGQGEMTAEDF